MNWTPDDLAEYHLRQKLAEARLNQLTRAIAASPAASGRPRRKTSGDIQRQNQHQRRIAYLRRGGRHAEADAEAAAYAAREAYDERERILAVQIERQRL